MNQLKVYEMRLKIYLLQDISQEQTYAVFANYIDSCLAKNESLLELHETNCYKQYSTSRIRWKKTVFIKRGRYIP